MIQPFIIKNKNTKYIKLHKKLYDRRIIEDIQRQGQGSISAILEGSTYYLVKLKNQKDSFDFLNYIIYYSRSQ